MANRYPQFLTVTHGNKKVATVDKKFYEKGPYLGGNNLDVIIIDTTDMTQRQVTEIWAALVPQLNKGGQIIKL